MNDIYFHQILYSDIPGEYNSVDAKGIEETWLAACRRGGTDPTLFYHELSFHTDGTFHIITRKI